MYGLTLDICLDLGELTVFCNGPERKSFCELRDHRDGTFTLIIRAQDIGKHQLHVQFDGKEVPGNQTVLETILGTNHACYGS